MNEFQSPYIEGQVLSPEDAAPSLHGFESAQPLPVPSQKIQGCSKSASDCLHKTKQIAHEFNHGTYCAAHLVLAMTLIPNATRQFELRKDDIDKAFRTAMQALIEMERGSPGHRSVPRPSEELSMIVALAEEVAKNRDNQEVSVDDLLTAVDRMPAETSATRLLRGDQKADSDPQIRQAVDRLSDNIGAQFRNLEQEVRSPSFVPTFRYELSELKGEIARQFGEIERKLGEMTERLTQRPQEVASAPTPNPEPPAPPRPAGIWDRLTNV